MYKCLYKCEKSDFAVKVKLCQTQKLWFLHQRATIQKEGSGPGEAARLIVKLGVFTLVQYLCNSVSAHPLVRRSWLAIQHLHPGQFGCINCNSV